MARQEGLCISSIRVSCVSKARWWRGVALPVNGVAQAARRKACLLNASAPEVPFCALLEDSGFEI